MNILLCNDDGVFAPGLKILAETLQSFATVTVVAPDRNCSAASHSLTVENPLRMRQLDNGFYSVNGTPADCVHLAFASLFSEQSPDLVVSGINAGANLGDDVLYSGTVAVAIEARNLGYSAFAVSLVGDEAYYITAAQVMKQLLSTLPPEWLQAKQLWNINVPGIPLQDLEGFAVSRLGRRHPSEPIVPQTDPRGRLIYWIGPPGPSVDAGVGTDFYAISENKVSITPLQTDLTDRDRLASLHALF